ncbi:MAG: hypothetical protein RBU23_03800 [Candidatus Auribacterota bacterium]|jgi:tetratricopeptide (TPR) repeat protein|nr:hypothetical protein [Candidatus Auribacterota bacterium]
MKLRAVFYCLLAAAVIIANGFCQGDTAIQQLAPEDEHFIAQLFAMDLTPDEMEPAQKQRIFNSIQRILGIIQNNPETTPDLLKSLTAKQIALFPQERKAYLDAASVYMKFNDMKKMHQFTIQSLSKQSQLYTGDQSRLEATAYTMMGQYLLETKQFPRAYEALNKALILEKSIALPFFLMGNVCFQLNKFEECQNAYSIGFITDIDAAYPVDFFFYGAALHRNGFTDKAKEIFEIGCYRYPNEQGLPLNLGYVLQQQDKLIESYLEFFREQIIFGPQGTFNKAAQFNIDMLSDLIPRRNDPREVQILNHINRWDTLMTQEKFEQALEELQKAVDLFADYNWTLNFFLQMNYMQLNRYSDAVEVLENMNARNPHVVINYIELAKAYMFQDNTDKASEYFAKARNASPDNWKLKQMEQSFQNAFQQERDN